MIVKMTQFETLLKVKILFCKVQSEYIWCSNTIVIYIVVHNWPKKMYLYLQIDMTWFCERLRHCSVINSSISSKVLNNRLVNCLLNLAQIFSAGLSSGLYGGRNTKATFKGICRHFALWNDPLSRTRILNSNGSILENSSRKAWNESLLQQGISRSNRFPSRGENAPNKYKDWNFCWNVQIGFIPLAVKLLPFFVIKPKRLSSSKYKFTFSKAAACFSQICLQIWWKFF